MTKKLRRYVPPIRVVKTEEVKNFPAVVLGSADDCRGVMERDAWLFEVGLMLAGSTKIFTVWKITNCPRHKGPLARYRLRARAASMGAVGVVDVYSISRPMTAAERLLVGELNAEAKKRGWVKDEPAEHVLDENIKKTG